MALADHVQFLAGIGLVEVLLPFLLVFTLTFGILERNQLFGKGKKNIHIMLAFVIGFLAIAAVNVLQVMNIIVAYFALALVSMLMIALVFGLVGAQVHRKNTLLFGISMAFFFVFILYGLASSGLFDIWRFVQLIFVPVIVVAGIAFAVYYSFGGTKTQSGSTPRPRSGGATPQGPAMPQGPRQRS